MRCDWVKREQSNSPPGRAAPTPAPPWNFAGLILSTLTTALVQAQWEMVGTSKGGYLQRWELDGGN